MLRHLAREKIANCFGNLAGVGFKREVACVEEADFGVRNIALEGRRSSGDEETARQSAARWTKAFAAEDG